MQAIDRRFIEGVAHEHGPLGPERLSFSSVQDTRLVPSELLPFTKYYCELAGVPVWSGYALQSPPSRGEDSRFSVSAAGWGQYLNEVPIDKTWVHTRLSEWRSLSGGTTLTTSSGINFGAGVEVGDAGVVLSLPVGNQLTQSKGSGVILDLGPNNLAKRIVVSWSHNGLWGGSTNVYFRGGNSEDVIPAIGGAEDAAIVGPLGGATSFTTAGTFATPRRYFSIFWYWSGVNTTATSDGSIRITSIQVFTDAADESGNASILKASTVISEALDLANQVSTDRSGVTATSFNLPHFATMGTVADAAAGANAYHEWQFFLESQNGAQPRPVFRAVPTTPRWVISRHDGHHVTLASGNDGTEIYNQVTVAFTDAAGKENQVTVTASPDRTLVGRAGRTRPLKLQMKAPSTTAAATQIANIALASHATTQIKGSINAQGWVRDYQSGAKVPAGWMRSNDIVLLPDEVDPDNGTIGRTGPLAGTRYDHQSLTTSAELDSRRDIYDQVLERLALVT